MHAPSTSSAAYFDVDGTLVGTNLIHPTVMMLANQRSPLQSLKKLGTALLDGPRMALAELADRRLFNEALFSHYGGITEDRMICLADEVFKSLIKPRIFPGTRDLIGKCKDAGQRVVLVTGGLDVHMRPLARYLEIDERDVIANRLEYKDRKATGKLLRPVVAGPGKASLIVEDARAHGHDLARCGAYSDSYSDVPMLSVVGHPFCINPDSRLRRLALAYDWPILDLQGYFSGRQGSK